MTRSQTQDSVPLYNRAIDARFFGADIGRGNARNIPVGDASTPVEGQASRYVSCSGARQHLADTVSSRCPAVRHEAESRLSHVDASPVEYRRQVFARYRPSISRRVNRAICLASVCKTVQKQRARRRGRRSSTVAGVSPLIRFHCRRRRRHLTASASLYLCTYGRQADAQFQCEPTHKYNRVVASDNLLTRARVSTFTGRSIFLPSCDYICKVIAHADGGVCENPHLWSAFASHLADRPAIPTRTSLLPAPRAFSAGDGVSFSLYLGRAGEAIKIG